VVNQTDGTFEMGSTFEIWGGSKSTYNLNGGTFLKTGSSNFMNVASGGMDFNVNGGAFSANNLTVIGSIGGASTLNLNGGTFGVAGTFEVGAAGTININTNGSMTTVENVAVTTDGLVNFNGGTGNAALNLLVGGGTVDVNGQTLANGNWANLVASGSGAVLKNSSATAASIAAGNTIWIWDGGQNLTIDASGGDIQIDSIITSSGQTTQTGIIKTGAKSLTLTGANDYTGTTTVSNGTLVVSNASLTATIQSNSVAVAFTNTPTNGTYAVLPGPVGAASFASNSVTGLGGKTATMTNSPNLVVQVTGGSTYPTFEDTYPGIIDPSEINPANGLSYLMNYALGGTGPLSSPALPVLTSNASTLTLTANIRNSGQGVEVIGQYAYDLAGQWYDVALTPTGTSSSVDNTTVKSFFQDVESGRPKKFMRLKATRP
jgi:autotransporter-associated beta strand protein